MNFETLRSGFRRQEDGGSGGAERIRQSEGPVRREARAGRANPSRELGLVAEQLTHAFGGRKVLDDTGISVTPGRIVGLVGPSGAGKTTIGRILSGRIPADSGVVSVDGTPITSRCVPEVAYLGQAPREACNPRWTLRRIIGEPVRIAELNGQSLPGTETEIVDRVAAAVLLDDALLSRTPNEVSDGQLQRAVIARALAQRPRYLVCDEPTSMLDPITTAAVVKALRAVCVSGASAGAGSGVRDGAGASGRGDGAGASSSDCGLGGRGAGLLFISHNLRLLNVIADDIYQLEDGRITPL